MGNGVPYGAELPLRCLRRELLGVVYNRMVAMSVSSLALFDEIRLSWCWRQFPDFDANDPVEKITCHKGISSRDMLPYSANTDIFAVTNMPTQSTYQGGKALREFCESPMRKGHNNPGQMTETRQRLANFWAFARRDFKARNEASGGPRLLQTPYLDTCLSTCLLHTSRRSAKGAVRWSTTTNATELAKNNSTGIRARNSSSNLGIPPACQRTK